MLLSSNGISMGLLEVVIDVERTVEVEVATLAEEMASSALMHMRVLGQNREIQKWSLWSFMRCS